MTIFSKGLISFPGRKIAALSGLFLLVFACGRASGPPSSIAQSRSGLDVPLPASPPTYDPAQFRFIVPPELAIMTVTITATEATFTASTQLVQEKTTALLQSVNAGSGCSAEISHYVQPVQPLGKYLRPNAKEYTSQMTINVEIDLLGMTDVGDRIQQLDDCLQRVPEFVDEDGKEDKAIAMTLSAVTPTIRDASVHREALLQRQFTALQGVATANQPPNQFQAAKTICTSNGTVKVISHQLSGIELAVDFDCYRESPGPDVLPNTNQQAYG